MRATEKISTPTLLLVLFLSACTAPPRAAPSGISAASVASSRPSEKIAQVEHGLLPPVRIQGETVPWSIEERMRAYRVPGLVVAVFEDYRVAWTKAYGAADVSTGARMTEDTLMQCGSISKSVAAAVALEEVRAGKLSLDADINTALKSWKVPESELARRTPVTLRRLLSHTAGITVHGFPGYATDEGVPSLRQVLDGQGPANTPAIVVDLLPGSKFRYSGGGISIVQQAVLDVEGGQPYPRIAAERVLGPWGMTHSTYEQPLPSERLAFASAGHMFGKPIPGKRNTYPEMGAAGLWTTAGDLSRFFIEIQRALGGRESHASKEIATLMTTRVAEVGPVQDVSLGTFISKKGDAEYFGHGGSNLGFEATALARKGKGYGAVIMANSNGSELLFDELLRAIAHEYRWEGYDEAPVERKTLDIARVTPFVGRWTDGGALAFELAVRDGRFERRFPMHDPEELVPTGDGHFVGRESGTRLRLTADNSVELGDEKSPRRLSRVTSDAATPIFLLETPDRFDDAVAAFRKRLSADPKDVAASERTLDGIGWNLLGKQHDAAAIRVARLRAAVHSDSPAAYEDLGEMYAWMGQRAQATEAYRFAIAVMNRSALATAAEKAAFAARMEKKIRRAAPP
ncbi:beta-lactamase family protein [Pendulispora brunnea]|uniref:Beta-lactamase family protein n=1 Tax=Pendulispora brunnea TaxID=2905690 RepID=A0ABZ2JYQ9_9BACT